MKPRPTSASRKGLVYFIIPLLAIVLGWFCVFDVSNWFPYEGFFDWFFFIGGLILILAGIITLGLFLWRARAAKPPQ